MNLARYTTEEIREELARRKARRVQSKGRALLMTVDGKALVREVREREARDAGGYVGEGMRAAAEGKKGIGTARGDGRFACYG